MLQQELEVSAVAVFANPYDTPKVLVSRRKIHPALGHYTLPGGKREKETQTAAAERELLDETNITLDPHQRLHRVKKPILFTLENQAIRMSLFYTWTGNLTEAVHVAWTETYKNDDWEFRDFSWLHEQTDNGLFPLPVYKGIIHAAKRTFGPWIGNMTIYQYDFPHGGLHRPQRLRQGLRK